MIKRVLMAVVLSNLLINTMPAQQNKSQRIEWERIRKAFEVYCLAPSAENADSLLSVMPQDFDNRTADQSQWFSTSEYIYNGEPFKVLDDRISHGDRFAIRIAFRVLIFSDAHFSEDVCHLIGKSIKANPEGYLEETKRFYSYAPKSPVGLPETLYPESYYFRPEEDPNFEELKKETLLRKSSLENVTRSDLLAFRDKCVGLLKDYLKTNRLC